MSESLISIIIPIYNREVIVKDTLNSILKQTYANWECIIIDDGSTDNTKKIVNSYIKNDNRIQFYNRPENIVKGANGCRNYGFKLAKGEFVNWFDSDDIMQPNFLEEKLKAFTTKTDAVIHRNNYSNYQLTEYRDSKFEYNNENSLFYNYAMETIEIQTCGFMWRQSYLKEKSLFNDAIMRYQDNEFHIRMLALQPNLVVLDSVLASIRSGDGHDSQISAKVNITKQKLYDVFFYRYQCLKLAKDNTINVNARFNKAITKKTLWAFYSGLRFETSFIKRAKDFFNHYNKLQLVYSNSQISYFDRFKSLGYIFKVIIFR